MMKCDGEGRLCCLNAASLSLAVWGPHIKHVEGDDVDIFNEEKDGVQIVAFVRLAIDRFGDGCNRKIAVSGVACLEQVERRSASRTCATHRTSTKQSP